MNGRGLSVTHFFLDLSRLFRRKPHRIPTGIDRLEFAYLCQFWALPADSVTFFIVQRQRVRVVPRNMVGALRAELAQTWIQGVDQDPPLAANRAYMGGRQDVLRNLTVVGHSLTNEARAQLRRGGRNGAKQPIILSTSHEMLHDEMIWGNLKTRLGGRFVVYLHDLIPLEFPEFAREGQALRHRQRLQTMLSQADLVLTNTHYTKDRLEAFCITARSGAPITAVLPLGVSPVYLQAPVGASIVDPSDPYFLVIGTVEPRKNHTLLLHAWRRLHQELGPRCPRLVIAGRRGWEIEHVVRMMERSELYGDRIVELSDLSDAELAATLRSACALLFPSFVEGYGIPLTEALSIGVPAICADIPALREVGGDIPDYVDPLDGPGWVEAISSYCAENSIPRAAQVQRMARYQVPTWESHFRLLDQAFALVGVSTQIGEAAAVPA